jgi:tRNA-specific 2-thiouridylase
MTGKKVISYQLSDSNEKKPLYVIGFDISKNRLIVGENEEVYKSEMTIKGEKLKAEGLRQMKLTVKIRYKAKEAECSVENTQSKEGQYLVRFNELQRAVTPGQSAVFYVDDKVIGGGIIQ